MSNHNGDYQCLNCFHSFRAVDELESHENICKNCNYCYKKMPKNNTLKYNHWQKPIKVSFGIYADAEPLFEITPRKIINSKGKEPCGLHLFIIYTLLI